MVVTFSLAVLRPSTVTLHACFLHNNHVMPTVEVLISRSHLPCATSQPRGACPCCRINVEERMIPL